MCLCSMFGRCLSCAGFDFYLSFVWYACLLLDMCAACLFAVCRCVLFVVCVAHVLFDKCGVLCYAWVLFAWCALCYGEVGV